MVQPLILQYYQLLPATSSRASSRRLAAPVSQGPGRSTSVRSNSPGYFEGTLERLLHARGRRGSPRRAVLALGLTGSYKMNAPVAKCLHDEDMTVRQLAVDCAPGRSGAGRKSRNKQI